MQRWDGWTVALGIGGLGNLANGVWMLADPAGWYAGVPGVPNSGPLNEHFVRDIGSLYSLMGVALLLAAVRPRQRLAAVGAVAAFYTLHALVHVYDTMRGLMPPTQWGIDAAPIYLPTLILLAILWLLARAPSPAGAR